MSTPTPPGTGAAPSPSSPIKSPKPAKKTAAAGTAKAPTPTPATHQQAASGAAAQSASSPQPNGSGQQKSKGKAKPSNGQPSPPASAANAQPKPTSPPPQQQQQLSKNAARKQRQIQAQAQAAGAPAVTSSPPTHPIRSPRPRTAVPSSSGAVASVTSPTPASPTTAVSATVAAPTRKPIAHRPMTASPAVSTSAPVAGASVAASLPPPLASPPPINAPASPKDIIVLKVGSASLSADDCKLLHLSNICGLVETICTLKQQGFQVILVTSGAVAVGCQRLGLTERPKQLVTKQAVAAIGQSRLMRVYDDLFSAMSQPIAQVLLTRENLSKHHHYVNALNTFRELLRLGVVPIVNENDTVAVEELRVGDNDTLSARVASLVQAKWLFLLTDVHGLYDSDPRTNPSAKIVHVVKEIDELNVSLGSSGSIGTGGMTTKLVAATIATAAGVHTGIIKSTELGHIQRMMRGESVGTHFLPAAAPLKAHKKWIAHGLAPEGCVLLDAGAARAIQDKKSLFASGVVGVEGSFKAGASVRLVRAPESATSGTNAASSAPSSSTGGGAATPPRAKVFTAAQTSHLAEFALCVVNYSSDELLRLAGRQSSDFASILGYDTASAELAHRENIVLTKSKDAATTTTTTKTNDAPPQDGANENEKKPQPTSGKGGRRNKQK